MLRAILRGAARRCPACGNGALFAGYTRLAKECSACHVAFDASPGEWTGALMFAQGFFLLLALGGWYVLFLVGAPSAIAIGWAVFAGLALPLALYPSFKGAWFGVMQAAGGLDAPGENTRP